MASYHHPIEAANPDIAKGLTSHYYLNFGVYLQVVGERRSTRAEERVLHFDLNLGALKIFLKENLKLTIKFDVINQIIFDESEPRTVLISCHDEHRYLLDFQNAEENLIFRIAYASVVDNSFDLNKFNRTLLLKGHVAKKSLSKFKDRYLILVPRKLFILSTKTSVYPRSVLSLLDATPRYDEVRNTVHLDVLGKEYVFRGDTKEESLEWFVALAHGCGLSPFLPDDWCGVYGDAGVQLPQHQGPQPDAAQLTYAQQSMLTRQQQMMSLQHKQQQQLQQQQHIYQQQQQQQQQDVHGFVAGPLPDGDRAGGGTGGIGTGYNPGVMQANTTWSDAGSIQTGASRFTSVPAAVAANTLATGGDGSRGLSAGGDAGSTYRPAASFKAIRGHSTQAKAPTGLIPLPGMPMEGSESVQLRGGRTPVVAPWHSNASATSFPASSGVPVPVPVHKASIPPGRFMRSLSLPGTLVARAGLTRGGRISSMPGPSHMTPRPGFGLQIHSEGRGVERSPLVTAPEFATPTQAATGGILRNKSNSPPWLTDTNGAATIQLPLASMASEPPLHPFGQLFNAHADGSLLTQPPGRDHVAGWVPGPAPDPYPGRDRRDCNDGSGRESREGPGEIGEDEFGGEFRAESDPEPGRTRAVSDGDRKRGAGRRRHKSRKEESYDSMAESRGRGQRERSAVGGSRNEVRYLGGSESSGEQPSCTGLFRHQRRRRNGTHGVDFGDGGDSSSGISSARSPGAWRKGSGLNTAVPGRAAVALLGAPTGIVTGGSGSSNGQEPGASLPVHPDLSLARVQHRSGLPTVYEGESGGNTDGERSSGAPRVAMKMTTTTQTTHGGWEELSASSVATARPPAARNPSAAAPPSPAPVPPWKGHLPASKVLPSTMSINSVDSDQRRRLRPTLLESTVVGASTTALPPPSVSQGVTAAPPALCTPEATALLASIEAILRSLGAVNPRVAAAAPERLVDDAARNAVDSTPPAPVGGSGVLSSSGCDTRGATITAAVATTPSSLLGNALPTGGESWRLGSKHTWRPQGQPGLPADASHSAVWQGRSEVDDTPCMRPSVVRSYIRGLLTRDNGIFRPPPPSAGGRYESLQGHRRSLQLLQWTQANYHSLLREFLNSDPKMPPVTGCRLYGDDVGVGGGSRRWLGGGNGAAAKELDRVEVAQVQWLQARAMRPSQRCSPPSRRVHAWQQTQGQRRQLQSQPPLSPPSQYLYPYPNRQPSPQPVSTTEVAWAVAAPVERSHGVRGSEAARLRVPSVLSDSRRRLQHSGGSSTSGDGESIGERGYERGLAPSPSPQQQQRLRSGRARQRNQWRCGDGAGVEWIDSGNMGNSYGVHGKIQDELCQGKQEEGSDRVDQGARKGCQGTSKTPTNAADGPHGSVWKCGARAEAAAAERSVGSCGRRRRRRGSVNPSHSGSECSSESSHSHSDRITARRGRRRDKSTCRGEPSMTMTCRNPTSGTAAAAGPVRSPREEGRWGNRVVRCELYGDLEHGHSTSSSISDIIDNDSDDDIVAVEEMRPLESQNSNNCTGRRHSLSIRRGDKRDKTKGQRTADADVAERLRSVKSSSHSRRRRPSWESFNRCSSSLPVRSLDRRVPSEPCARGDVSRDAPLTPQTRGEGPSSCLAPAAHGRRKHSPPPPAPRARCDGGDQLYPSQRSSDGYERGPPVDSVGGSRYAQPSQHYMAAADGDGAASTSGRTGGIGCSCAEAAERVCTQPECSPIRLSPEDITSRRSVSVSGSSECDSLAISACAGATTSSTTDTCQRGVCTGMAAVVASSSSSAAAHSLAAGSSGGNLGSSRTRAFSIVDGGVEGGSQEMNTRPKGRHQHRQQLQLKHNHPQREGQLYQAPKERHVVGVAQTPVMADGSGGRIERSSGSEGVPARISLSDFSRLAAASAAHSGSEIKQATAVVMPAAVTTNAETVSRRVANEGRSLASCRMGPGELVPSPPRPSPSIHGASTDTELPKLKQDTSSLPPVMCIPPQGKQPPASKRVSRRSTPTQCSPALSRSSSGSPSLRIAATGSRLPEAGDEDEEGRNSSFAFPVPATWTSSLIKPPLHQQHQWQTRPAISMTGETKASPTPRPMPPSVVKEPTITLSQLLALLQNHLYGEQADGTGGAALGNFPSGVVDGFAVQTPAAADTPLAPFGETYRPIHNPLFRPQPDDRDPTGQALDVLSGSKALRPQAQQQQLWWALPLQQQQQPSVHPTQFAAGYGSAYQAVVTLPQPQDRHLRPHPQQPQGLAQPKSDCAQQVHLQQQLLSATQQQIYRGMDGSSGGTCCSCQPRNSSGPAVPVASTAMDAVTPSERELVWLLRMPLQPGLQRSFEETAEANAARCSTVLQNPTSISTSTSGRVSTPASVPQDQVPLPSLIAAPTSGPARRPSISPMTRESSRCIQHAAMVAAEAATNAVSEAMSALSRIGYQATTVRAPSPASMGAVETVSHSPRNCYTSCNAISSVSSDESMTNDTYQANRWAEHLRSTRRSGGRGLAGRLQRCEAEDKVAASLRRSQQRSLRGGMSGEDYHQRHPTGPMASSNAGNGTGGPTSLRPVSEASGENRCGGDDARAVMGSHANRRRSYVHTHPGRAAAEVKAGPGAPRGLHRGNKKWATESDDGTHHMTSHDGNSSEFGGSDGDDGRIGAHDGAGDGSSGGPGDAIVGGGGGGGGGDGWGGGGGGGDALIDPGSASPYEGRSLQSLLHLAASANINTEELMRGLAHGAIQTALRRSLHQQLQQNAAGAPAAPAVPVLPQQLLQQQQQQQQ